MLKLMSGLFLNDLPQYLETLQVRPESLLAKVGLTIADLKGPSSLISGHAAAQLLALAASETGKPLFGLAYSQFRNQLASAGVIGAMGHTSPTLGDALRLFFDNYHSLDQSSTWTLNVENDIAYMHRTELLADETDIRQLSMLEIGSSYRSLRGVFGPRWHPLSVTFAFSEQQRSDYTRFFHCPVYFNQPGSGLAFPARLLSIPMPRQDEQIYKILHSQIGLPADLDSGIVPGVRRLLIQHLGSRSVTMEEIAALLNLHPRTLLRRLKEHGHTFKQLALEARISLAVGFLDNSSLSISEIAEMAGYSEVSAFSRAFSTQYGMSPRQYREQKIPAHKAGEI